MSVESVNNSSNNAGLYSSGAALVGAGAGAATAYLTRPFLKDGAPTDEFIKKMDEKLINELPEELRELVHSTQSLLKNASEEMMSASSVEELKNIYLKRSVDDLRSQDFNKAKQMLISTYENLDNAGTLDSASSQFIEKINGVKDFDELRTIVAENFDKEYAGKSLEEIKNAMKTEAINMNKKIAQNMCEPFWDSSKKCFVNCEDGLGNVIKKAARSIQGKYALVYGAIGAAVLGLGTLLCCGGKKSPAPDAPQVDTQA